MPLSGVDFRRVVSGPGQAVDKGHRQSSGGYSDMFLFQRWWRAMAAATALACGTAALAAPSLTTIKDVLYKADGTRFSGTVTISWSNFSTADQSTIPVQATTIEVVNGTFSVRLVPTTTASAGANYRVRYTSQGKFQFEEVWAVPPSDTPLTIRDVRVGTGSVVGPPPVLTQVDIGDVNGLSAELSSRPRRGTNYAPSRAAVINGSGQIDAADGNLGDCVRVDGTSGPCGGGVGETSTVAFADAETPAGAVNGTNATFSTANVPAPAASVALFRNGILMKPGADFTLNGSAITFLSGAIPEPGDLLTVSYRYTKAGQLAVTANFVDAETPAGAVNGTNAVFTVAQAPSPAASLQLFRNGVLMKQGADYSVNGATLTFVSAGVPQAGDLLQASYRYNDTGGGQPTAYNGPQVLCNGTGTSTASTVAATLGECVIGAGVLAAGDRVEIRAEFAHQGTAAGFSAAVQWGASTLLSRSLAASETVLSVRSDAVIYSSGAAQWSVQSWGGSAALSTAAGSASTAILDPITIRFNGWLASAGSDQAILRNFTVLRYPAQLAMM